MHLSDAYKKESMQLFSWNVSNLLPVQLVELLDLFSHLHSAKTRPVLPLIRKLKQSTYCVSTTPTHKTEIIEGKFWWRTS